eukprot:gene10692-3313_t
MKVKLLLFFFITVVFSECIHEKIQNKTTLLYSSLDESFILNIKSNLKFKNSVQRKNIEEAIYSPIRIQFVTSTILNDETNFHCKIEGNKFKTGIPQNEQQLCKSRKSGEFDNCWDFCKKSDIISLEDSKYIEKVLENLSGFISNLISVIPVDQPFCFGDSYCGRAGVKIPSSDKCGTGSISNIDTQIYVTSRPSPDQVLAFSTFCAISAGLERPIAAWINVSPNLVNKTKYPEEVMLSILKHELIHALGFTSSGFQFFKDANGEKYQELTRIEERKFNGFNENYVKLVLPNTLKQAKNHFNCQDMDGVYLENEGNPVGTVGSHWKQLHFFKELMVGNIVSFPEWGLVADGKDQVLSRITLGLLEDSGFYKINYTNADFLSWGRNFGCDMLHKRCEDWKRENYFCSVAGEESCSPDYFQKSACKIARYSQNLNYNQHLNDGFLGGISVLEYCPFYLPQIQQISNCKLFSNNNLTLIKSGQTYGENSLCFQSNLIEKSISNPSNLRCFETICSKIGNNLYKMMVKFGNNEVECLNLQTIQTNFNGYSGTIQCPDINLACEIQLSKMDYSTSQIYNPKQITSNFKKHQLNYAAILLILMVQTFCF